MIELTRCGAPDNDRYLPAVMTQGDASTYQTMIDNSTMQKRSQQMVGPRLRLRAERHDAERPAAGYGAQRGAGRSAAGRARRCDGGAADRTRSWPAACRSERHERGGADPPQLVEEPDGAQRGPQRDRELFDRHAEHHRHPRHPLRGRQRLHRALPARRAELHQRGPSIPSASWSFCPRSVRPIPSSNSSRKEKREKRGALLPLSLLPALRCVWRGRGACP